MDLSWRESEKNWEKLLEREHGCCKRARWVVLVGTQGRNFLWILLETKLEATRWVVVKNLSAL